MITSSAPGAPALGAPDSGSSVTAAIPAIAPSSGVPGVGAGRAGCPGRDRPQAPRAPRRAAPASGASTRTSFAVAGDTSSSRQAWRKSRSRPSGPSPRGPGPVDRIARHGVAERREVDPDLVGAAGDEVQLQQRPAREALADAVAGHRRPPVGHDRHPLAVPRDHARSAPRSGRRMPRPRPGRARGRSCLHAAGLELRHEAGLGRVRLGDHDQAGRVAVQAVHDPRPGDARDATVVGRRGPAARSPASRSSGPATGGRRAPRAC